MFYTPASSFNQVKSKRLNKKSGLASLPTIYPRLISISRAASRLIDEMEDIFNQITNAASNDGLEVTVPRREGRYWSKGGWTDCWYKETRLALADAFDSLVYRSYASLMGDISRWHVDATGFYLTGRSALNGEYKIDAPLEIKIAIQALNLVCEKSRSLGFATVN
jgi:hypothetical protein